MIPPSKPSPIAARDDHISKKELASTLWPVRLLVAGTILLPVAVFLVGWWGSFNHHLSAAPGRGERNLKTK